MRLHLCTRLADSAEVPPVVSFTLMPTPRNKAMTALLTEVVFSPALQGHGGCGTARPLPSLDLSSNLAMEGRHARAGSAAATLVGAVVGQDLERIGGW